MTACFDAVAQTYDEIAREHRKSKQLPVREHVDTYTLVRLVGPVDGKSVVDLACGEGHYTRLLKRAGAAEIVGVDISREMIRLAQETERAHPLGIDYRVADVATLKLGGAADLVVAAYLLNYAKSRSELLTLCRAIERHLKPGGRFVGLNANMMLDPEHYGECERYGVVYVGPASRKEGDPIGIRYANADGSIAEFDNYYLAPETYAAVFAEAGLQDFAWQGPWVSEAGIEAFPKAIGTRSCARRRSSGSRPASLDPPPTLCMGDAPTARRGRKGKGLLRILDRRTIVEEWLRSVKPFFALFDCEQIDATANQSGTRFARRFSSIAIRSSLAANPVRSPAT